MYVDYKKIGIRIAQRRKEIKMKQNVLAKKQTFQITTYQILKMVTLYQVSKHLRKFAMH
jgi:hypothetical protein